MATLERHMINGLEAAMESWRSATRPLESARPDCLALGKSVPHFSQGRATSEYLSVHELMTHLTATGASGMGKSVLLRSILLQGFVRGIDSGFIDTHDTIDHILEDLTHLVKSGQMNEKQLDRVRVFDLGDTEWTVSLDVCRSRDLFEACRSANSLLAIVKNYNPADAIGPQTEEAMHHLFQFICEAGLSLIDSERVLRDERFRRSKLDCVRNPETRYFWARYSSLTPAMQARISLPIYNKLSSLTSDPRVRQSFGIPHGDIDFRAAMDRGQTILINLSRAHHAENIRAYSSFVLHSIQKAIFSRADTPPDQRRPWLLIADEVQSFAAGSTLLSPLLRESRKFRVGLVLALQDFSSIDKELLQSIHTNVSTRMLFRQSQDEAKRALAGLRAEDASVGARQLSTLPIGSAMLIRNGGLRGIIRLPYTEYPPLNESQSIQVRKMRRRIGRPFSLSDSASVATVQSSPTRMRAEANRITVLDDALQLDPQLIEGDE